MADMNTLKQPQVFLKILEIIMLIVAIATFFSTLWGWGFFASSIILGCFINAILFLCLYLMGYSQNQQSPMELLLNSYYCLGLFVSSILLMSSSWSSNLVACGAFCLLLVPIYGMDIYFSLAKLSIRPLSFPPSANPPTMADATANPTSSVDPSTLSPPHNYQSSGILPPYQHRPDTLDTGITRLEPSSLYVTNPVYPPAFDYPPTNTDKSSSYPPEVSSSPRP
ncbi:uncharacterized protein [Panulirus ornatus]|uniref:uncharacterized protein n=1 Tax=Panulirus ornatus TaxID=150431 RepID=UPI003A898201